MKEAMLCKSETQIAFLLQHVLGKLLTLVNPATVSDDQDYECQIKVTVNSISEKKYLRLPVQKRRW